MKYLVLVFASVVILLGCTSTPSMENYTNDPDRMWEEGKKLSERGEKLLTRGEKDLEKARAMLREGEGSDGQFGLASATEPSHASPTRVNRHFPLRVKRQHIVRLGRLSGYFHTRRSNDHAGHRQTEDFRPISQYLRHEIRRNVALENISVQQRSVTRGEARAHAVFGFDRSKIG